GDGGTPGRGGRAPSHRRALAGSQRALAAARAGRRPAGCAGVVRVALSEPRLLGIAALQRFIVAPNEGEVAIGNLGCEVPIALEPGVATRATVTAIDLAGQPHPGRTIVVVGAKSARP